jgi:FMN phosphatase YigB (HAD superfamily)
MSLVERVKSWPMREQFEAYFADSRRNRGAKKRPNFDVCSDGTYADDHTQRHWWTWQQALRAAREAVAAEADREMAQMRQALELAQELASALEQMKSEIEQSGQTHCLGSCYETAGRVLKAWWPTSAALSEARKA